MIANPSAIPTARQRIHALLCACAGDLDNCRALVKAAVK